MRIVHLFSYLPLSVRPSAPRRLKLEAGSRGPEHASRRSSGTRTNQSLRAGERSKLTSRTTLGYAKERFVLCLLVCLLALACSNEVVYYREQLNCEIPTSH